MGGSKVMMSNESHHTPNNETRNQAYTDLLDVGDRVVDLEGLGNRRAALGAQLVEPEAAKSDP